MVSWLKSLPSNGIRCRTGEQKRDILQALLLNRYPLVSVVQRSHRLPMKTKRGTKKIQRLEARTTFEILSVSGCDRRCLFEACWQEENRRVTLRSAKMTIS